MKLLVEIQDNVYKSLKNNRGTAIENVMAIAAVIGGQPLPDDCEILTREAYADLCLRASQEPNCSEILTGSTAKIDVPDNNVGNIDCILRADAIHAVSEALKHTFVEYEDIANKVIGKLPPVIPQEPRKGHWVTRPHVYGVTYCSECGFELKIDNTNYCPNCSADMREVEK